MNRKWVGIWMLVSLFVGAGGMYIGIQWIQGDSQEETYVKNNSSSFNDSEDLAKVRHAFNLIAHNYVEEIEEEVLVEGAIQGMLATLEDPYSVYMDAETARQFNETLKSSFEGIGTEVSMKDGKMVIIAPFKNSPAEKAGIKPNDQIVKVDGKSLEGMDLMDATLMIKGEKGTKVKLEIIREGRKEPLIIEVVRDKISQVTVHSKVKKMNGNRIGYVQITSFSEETAKEFKKQLSVLEEKGLDGLVLDVRGNPGGLLDSVEEILKELVTKQKPLYQIEERSGKKTRYFSALEQKKEYPIAVLTDGGSASASEILAGALKEAGNYPIIGEKTFGKGTVQQPVPMGDGSNIKLTLFKWLTPNGNWIHHTGVEPTVEVKQPAIFNTHPIQSKETLKQDMNSEHVKNAQQILAGVGYEPGREDGYFDAQTVIAVKAFQRQNKLEANGMIDKRTAAALEEAAREEMKREEKDAQLQHALRLLAK